jgi:hypothetical protein
VRLCRLTSENCNNGRRNDQAMGFFSGNQQISFESYTQKKIDKQMA